MRNRTSMTTPAAHPKASDHRVDRKPPDMRAAAKATPKEHAAIQSRRKSVADPGLPDQGARKAASSPTVAQAMAHEPEIRRDAAKSAA